MAFNQKKYFTLSIIPAQKHHYHELSPETQAKLGALPHGFTRFWIDRFPRLMSHSYHALQSCAKEHVFNVYYATEYMFSKPNYFYEITEDFRPFLDNSNKQRDSPKRYNNSNNKDYRYKGMDYPNFASDRMRQSKKGTYNFHRNYQPIQRVLPGNDTEITRSSDDSTRSVEPRLTATNDCNVWKIDNVRDKSNIENIPRMDKQINDVPKQMVDDRVPHMADDKPQKLAEKKTQKIVAKTRVQEEQDGTGNIIRSDDNNAIDGFTKVRHRKRQKSESQN